MNRDFWMTTRYRSIITATFIVSAAMLVGCGKPVVESKPPELIEFTTTEQLETLAKTDHITLLTHCLDNYNKNYRNYEGIFYKQERIGKNLTPLHEISAKFQDSPYSVVLKWLTPPPPADTILYIEGKNDNNLLARPAAVWQRMIVGTRVKRDPTSPEVMKHAIHPITRFGFKRGLQSLLRVYKLAKKNGDLKMEYRGFAKIDSRETLVIARHLPQKEGYPTAITVLYIDLKYLVPVCVREYHWDKSLTAHYEFRKIQFNTSLTDKDFLPENNGM